MAQQTGRSLRLSAQGIQTANTALLKFGSKADLAAQLQMSRTTINKFFKGEPVEQKKIRAICKKLKLILEEVVDLPTTVESELVEQNQNNSSDIDELVREVRSRCCDKVQHLYSKIQLLNRQQIDVDKLYVDVYVLEKLSSESQATIPDLLRDSYLRSSFDRLGLGRRQKRSPGFEIAAQYSRLMILGKPGAGKTTFLRHLAVACCKDEFLADYIPLLIKLRDINASEFNLLNHIHQEFDLADEEQTKQILKQGKVLILLDGLDEVPSQSRREVQDHIYRFSQSTQYYKNHFILTCRTQTTEYALQTFEYIEVADFKPEQIEIFARNWFAALAETPKQGEELTAQFLEKVRLPENKQTAELAVTPLLLSLTCWVFNDLKDLPSKLSNLYEQGLNLLLEKWDEKRGLRRTIGNEIYRKLSVKEKQNLLIYVATHKFEQEQYVLFEQSEVESYIAEYLGISTESSQIVLNSIESQHGLLIEQAQQIWSFSHLTFQEYFTAKWFCSRHNWDGLVSNITDLRWQEVFLLTVNILPSADDLLRLMKIKIDAVLASDKKLQQFLSWVNQKSLSVEAPYKLAAVRANYFDLTRVLDLDFYIDDDLDFDLDDVLDLDLKLARTLYPNFDFDDDLDLNFDFDRDLVRTLLRALVRALDLGDEFDDDFDDNLDDEFDDDLDDDLDDDFDNELALLRERKRDLDRKLALLRERKRDLDREFNRLRDLSVLARERNLVSALAYEFDLTCLPNFAYVLNLDRQLQKKLHELKERLPNLESDLDIFKQWWEADGQTWTEQLRAVMIKYRNIGHDWQFSDAQKELLQQYHDANQLLVNCLNSGCGVSDGVKEEIEETLLLPIAEIEKRQQQM